MRPTTTPAENKPLLALTAADLMTAPVMNIPQEMTLREAARLLTQSHISGAPVVDPQGHCIGVLSSSDFVTWAVGENVSSTCFLAPWGEMIDVEDAPDNEIRHYMTTQPIAVAPSTPIGELAQKMVDVHIHRVLVVADKNQPPGIVTSTDILAALARAARDEVAETKPPKRRRTAH